MSWLVVFESDGQQTGALRSTASATRHIPGTSSFSAHTLVLALVWVRQLCRPGVVGTRPLSLFPSVVDRGTKRKEARGNGDLHSIFLLLWESRVFGSVRLLPSAVTQLVVENSATSCRLSRVPEQKVQRNPISN